MTEQRPQSAHTSGNMYAFNALCYFLFRGFL